MSIPTWGFGAADVYALSGGATTMSDGSGHDGTNFIRLPPGASVTFHHSSSAGFRVRGRRSGTPVAPLYMEDSPDGSTGWNLASADGAAFTSSWDWSIGPPLSPHNGAIINNFTAKPYLRFVNSGGNSDNVDIDWFYNYQFDIFSAPYTTVKLFPAGSLFFPLSLVSDNINLTALAPIESWTSFSWTLNDSPVDASLYYDSPSFYVGCYLTGLGVVGLNNAAVTINYGSVIGTLTQPISTIYAIKFQPAFTTSGGLVAGGTVGFVDATPGNPVGGGYVRSRLWTFYDTNGTTVLGTSVSATPSFSWVSAGTYPVEYSITTNWLGQIRYATTMSGTQNVVIGPPPPDFTWTQPSIYSSNRMYVAGLPHEELLMGSVAHAAGAIYPSGASTPYSSIPVTLMDLFTFNGYTMDFINMTPSSNTSWDWTFRNGGGVIGTSSVQNPVFTFPGTGSYTVTLVTNQGTIEHTVVVT